MSVFYGDAAGDSETRRRPRGQQAGRGEREIVTLRLPRVLWPVDPAERVQAVTTTCAVVIWLAHSMSSDGLSLGATHSWWLVPSTDHAAQRTAIAGRRLAGDTTEVRGRGRSLDRPKADLKVGLYGVDHQAGLYGVDHQAGLYGVDPQVGRYG